MKLTRFTAALSILAAIIVLILRFLGVLGGQEASDTARTVIAVLLVIGLGLAAVSLVLPKKQNEIPPEKKGQGPQF